MGAFDDLTRGGVLAPTENPFTDQPGRPPPELTGRDPVLRQLLDVIQQVEAGRAGGGLFLHGPRGLGKTSLLVETAGEAARRGITVVRVELARDPEEAVALLLAGLAQAVGRSALATLATRVAGVRVGPVGVELEPGGGDASAGVTGLLVEAARSCHPEGLLVLVDEAQEHPPTSAAVVRAGHRATQDGLACGVVLAGLPHATRDVVAEVSYAERIPTSLLGPLDADAAFRAIADPLAAHGVRLDATRRAHVATVTGGYPFFVQVLGRELWLAADAPAHVSADAWRAAVKATAARTDRWLEDRYSRLPGRQQRYLRAANEVGWPARTGDVAAHLDTSHASLSPARAGLLDDGVLWVPRRGEVDLVIPPFAAWLSRTGGEDVDADD